MEDKKCSAIEAILEKTGEGWTALWTSPIMLLASFCIGLLGSDEVKCFFCLFFPMFAMVLFAICAYRDSEAERTPYWSNKIEEIKEIEEEDKILTKVGRYCIVWFVMIILGAAVGSKVEISEISLPSIIEVIQSLPATIRSLPHWTWWLFVGVVVIEEIVCSVLNDMCEDDPDKWSKKCKAMKILIGVTLVLLIGYFVVRNFG